MRQPRPTRIEQFHRAVEGSAQPHAAPSTRNGHQQRRVERRSRRGLPVVVFALWCAVGAVAACAAVGFGFGAVSGTRDLLVLAASVGAAAIAVVGARRCAAQVPTRPRRIAVAVAAGTAVMFSVGAVVQLELDGRPQLAISNTARAHDLVEELYADILSLRDADALIAYEQADARARYNDYQPTVSELRSIANRWSRTDLGALPDPDLIDVVQGVKVAATFGAEALEIRFRIITEPDERSEQALAENRAALFEATLSAAAGLKPLAEQYQVDIGAGGRGE